MGVKGCIELFVGECVVEVSYNLFLLICFYWIVGLG